MALLGDPLLYLTLCMCITLAESGYAHRCSISDYTRPRRDNNGRPVALPSKCGRRLARHIIETVCGGNAASLEKRLVGEKFQSSKDNKMVSVDNGDIFQSSIEASAFINPSKRGRANDGISYGLVCECCINRCTPVEQAQYCNSARRRRRRAIAAPAEEQRVLNGFKGESADDIRALEELLNDPLIQQLEKQKAINIARARGSQKRLFNNAIKEQLAQDEEYLQLKEHVKAKVERFLTDGHKFSINNGRSLSDNFDEQAESNDKLALNRLWKLIKEDD